MLSRFQASVLDTSGQGIRPSLRRGRGNLEVGLSVEERKGRALTPQQVVKRGAHGRGVRHAWPTAAPDACLTGNLQAVDVWHVATILAVHALAHRSRRCAASRDRGEACQRLCGWPFGDPPRCNRREGRTTIDLLRRHSLAVLARSNLVGGLRKEGGESLALTVHDVVKRLTEAHALRVASATTAPHAWLALDLEAIDGGVVARIPAAQARELVHNHVATKLVIHEAPSLLGRLLPSLPP
mmetsp:Transcript_114599/g.304651  ORF Transcript_114599/g.304651 Transcript_114599/m.304651 type:complete len:240 (+) Transcript_114599:1140-1859(+)